MVDIATVTAAISGATGAVALFDKISDQVERFISKEPEPLVPPEQRMMIEESDGDIISRGRDGTVVQRITAEDLRNLPENQLLYIITLQKSMENYESCGLYLDDHYMHIRHLVRTV